jgi:hypothetical protein
MILKKETTRLSKFAIAESKTFKKVKKKLVPNSTKRLQISSILNSERTRTSEQILKKCKENLQDIIVIE